MTLSLKYSVWFPFNQYTYTIFVLVHCITKHIGVFCIIKFPVLTVADIARKLSDYVPLNIHRQPASQHKNASRLVYYHWYNCTIEIFSICKISSVGSVGWMPYTRFPSYKTRTNFYINIWRHKRQTPLSVFMLNTKILFDTRKNFQSLASLHQVLLCFSTKPLI